MFILLLFSGCFAQEDKIFDPDDNFQGAATMDFSSFFLGKLSTLLNKDILQTIAIMAEDIEGLKDKMKEMKEGIVSNEEKIVKNSNTIADVNLIAKRNSAQITSVSGQHETRIVNNIQRLNSMDNKMVDMKMNVVRNEEKIVQNSDTISDVNSIAERNSALITSVSEEIEQQQTLIMNNFFGSGKLNVCSSQNS